MKSLLEKKSNLIYGQYWLISVLLSILSVFVLLSAVTQGEKWLIAVVLGLIIVYLSFILQKKLWPLLIFSAIFLMPVKIDFYLLRKPIYILQNNGLPVSAFDLILMLLIFYWVIQLMTRREEFNFYPSISIPALIFIFLTGISVYHSEDRLNGFIVFILTSKSYILFIFFANIIKTQREMNYVILAVIAGVVFQGIIGGLQYLTGGLLGVFGEPHAAYSVKQMGASHFISRVGGSLGHPNALAKYLNIYLPALLCVTFMRVKPLIKILACMGFVLGGITEILTSSRGSWLALFIALIFVFYRLFKFRLKSGIKSSIVTILIVLVIFGISLAGFSNVRSRLFESDFGAAKSRIPMAQVAVNVIRDNPWTGVGLDNYTKVMSSYDRTRLGITHKFPHPVHNTYLLIAAESGIPALVVFLWLLGAVFFKARPSMKNINSSISLLQLGWLGGLLTWIISGMFDRPIITNGFLMWFPIAMIVATQKIYIDENKS